MKIIDVRERLEFDSGHLIGSINVPISEVPNLSLSKDEEILVYCRSGARAAIAKKILETKGFTNVVNIGGLEQAREYQNEKV